MAMREGWNLCNSTANFSRKRGRRPGHAKACWQRVAVWAPCLVNTELARAWLPVPVPGVCGRLSVGHGFACRLANEIHTPILVSWARLGAEGRWQFRFCIYCTLHAVHNPEGKNLPEKTSTATRARILSSNFAPTGKVGPTPESCSHFLTDRIACLARPQYRYRVQGCIFTVRRLRIAKTPLPSRRPH
jgi:hypothetical protein